MHASSDDARQSESPPSPSGGESANDSPAQHRGSWRSILDQHRWLVFVLPFAVYMIFNSFEPSPPEIAVDETAAKAADDAGTPADDDGAETSGQAGGGIGSWLGIDIRYEDYPLIYSLKIVATLIAIGLVCPGYREFPLRVSPLAFVVGAVGVVIWVGLCALRIEPQIYSSLGFTGFGQRPGFNPLEQLQETPGWAYGFLAIRFFGLVVVVALIEEMFLRGFVMRYATQPDWQDLPIGNTNMTAVAITTVVFAATHPSEILAAVAWFSAVTWLMFRTKNIWDCIVAHAVTNLLMGIYVVEWNQWQLM